MYSNIIFFVIAMIICACSTTNTANSNDMSIIEQELNSSDTGSKNPTVIPDSKFGNVRIAFLTTRKIEAGNQPQNSQLLGMTGNVSLSTVLVHKSNKQCLKLSDEYQNMGIKFEDVPLSAFDYKADTLPLSKNRSVVIIEDELMAQLLDLAKNQVGFFNYTQNINKGVLNQSNWPEKDLILIEENGVCNVMVKPKSFGTGLGANASPEGKAYLALKNNILLSRSTGYTMQIINVKRIK